MAATKNTASSGPGDRGLGDDLNDEKVFERMRGGIEKSRYEKNKEKGVNITPYLLLVPLIALLWGGSTFIADNRSELVSPLPVTSGSLSDEGSFEPGIGGGPEEESTGSAAPSSSPKDEILFDMDSRTREF